MFSVLFVFIRTRMMCSCGGEGRVGVDTCAAVCMVCFAIHMDMVVRSFSFCVVRVGVVT